MKKFLSAHICKQEDFVWEKCIHIFKYKSNPVNTSDTLWEYLEWIRLKSQYKWENSEISGNMFKASDLFSKTDIF